MALTQPNYWQAPSGATNPSIYNPMTQKPTAPTFGGSGLGMGSLPANQFGARNPYQSGQGLMGGGLSSPLAKYNAATAGNDPISGLPIHPAGTPSTTMGSNVPMPMGTANDGSMYGSGSPANYNVMDIWKNTQVDPSMAAGDFRSNSGETPYSQPGQPTQPFNGTKPTMPGYDPNAGQGDPSAFNTQYGTPQNVSQYMNPFLNSIMDRGNSALSNWNPQAGTTDKLGAFGLNGYNPTYKQTDRLAPTMDNLNMYADPSYQFRLQQGVNGLDASAAAKGGLLSSGHMKDITDYSQGLASTEYNNMFNRFNQTQNNIQGDNNTNNNFAAGQLSDMYGRASGDRSFGQGAYQNDVNNGMGAMQNAQGQFNTDRSYMTNQYNTMNAADTANNQYQNNFNADMYKYGNADYEGKLNDYYNQNNGISQTGINASGQSAQNTQDLASALATLGMSAAQIQATIKMASSGAQAGMIGSGLGLLGTFLGGK